MKIAILTGASAGLGKEYFYNLTKRSDIDCIWLIARRKDRLEQLAADTDKPCVILPLDLTDEQSFEILKEKLTEQTVEIKILINNAGFGKLGNVEELSVTDQTDMVRLNCAALTAVTTVCLQFMQKGSFIVNVCSIASFAPNPRMTVYSSTKAYVLSFSKSLRQEVKKRGINVLATCPGPMNTEFLSVANITGNSKTFDILPYCDPKKVAAHSLKQAEKGRAIHTPKLFYKFYRILAKLLPHSFIMKLSKT